MLKESYKKFAAEVEKFGNLHNAEAEKCTEEMAPSEVAAMKDLSRFDDCNQELSRDTSSNLNHQSK